MSPAPGVAGLGLRLVDLPSVPGLGALYVRGAVGSTRARLASALPGRERRHRHDVRLPDVAYRVTGLRADADRLTDYQHLLGEPASDTLPPGFVHVLAFPVATAVMVRPDFPLPLLGMVHLANVVEQRQALRLGDELEVRAWAQDLRPHRRGTQVDLVTEVRVTSSGTGPQAPPAWRGVSTYLARGVHPSGDHATAGTDAPDHTFQAPEPTGRWRLAADTGRRYAAVSGDRNPIHLSAASARAFGFPRAIAHGMYTAARALADIGEARGDAYAWTVTFAAPVLLPGTVATRVAPLPGAPAAPDVRGAFEYSVWRPGTGRLHLSGTVTPLAYATCGTIGT